MLRSILALALLVSLAGCGSDGVAGSVSDALGSDRPASGADSGELSLRAFEPVAGTSVLTAALASDAWAESSYGVRGAYQTDAGALANVLFFDTASGESRWLMPYSATRILSRYEVAPDSGLTRALVYTVVSEDTDEDGRLTAADLKDLVAVEVDGTGRRLIAEDIERSLGTFEVSPEAVVFTFVKDGQPDAVEFAPGAVLHRPLPLEPIPAPGSD